MNETNYLWTYFARIYNYFTASAVRRFFFCSIILVLVCAVWLQIQYSKIVMVFLLLSCFASLGASCIDSVMCKSAFVSEMSKFRFDDLSFEELRYIKRKRREFNYSIGIKIFLIIMICVFLVQII